MINPIMAAIAVFLSAALFTCSGCAIISQIAAAMPTSRTASPSSTPAVSSAPATRFYTGDGGRGIRLAVLVPTAANLASDQNYLPTMVQGELVTNLSSYSAISVLDRLRLETVLKETESGIYKNEEDFGRLGEIANVDYVLTGSITRTSTGHTLQLQIVGTGGDTIGVTRAAYSGTPTVAEMDNFTGIRRASLELLAQMGVALTDAARNELSGAASADRVNAQTSLAQGIVAQRQGNTIETMARFNEAASFDSSLAEAAARANAMSSTVRTGRIGDDIRNDIAWRREWIQLYEDASAWFRANPPVFADYFYSPDLTQGPVNYQNETVTFRWVHGCRQRDLAPYRKMLEDLAAGLSATGRAKDWGLDPSIYNTWNIYANPRVSAGAPLGAVMQFAGTWLDGTMYWNRMYQISAELVNDRGQRIATSHGYFTTYVRSSSGRNDITYVNAMQIGDVGYTVEFHRIRLFASLFQGEFIVKADDITDTMTIRITNIYEFSPYASTWIQHEQRYGTWVLVRSGPNIIPVKRGTVRRLPEARVTLPDGAPDRGLGEWREIN